jgi:hypothetical protein
VTGNSAQHQRDLAQAIKTARELVLLPYTQRTVTERPGGRGGGRDRGDRGERTLSDTDGPSTRGRSRDRDEVALDVTDDTQAADAGAAAAEVAEVEELVEEMAEDALAKGAGSEEA